MNELDAGKRRPMIAGGESLPGLGLAVGGVRWGAGFPGVGA